MSPLASAIRTPGRAAYLNDDWQGWPLKTLMKKLVFLPGRLSQRSRQWMARVLLPGTWLS